MHLMNTEHIMLIWNMNACSMQYAGFIGGRTQVLVLVVFPSPHPYSLSKSTSASIFLSRILNLESRI